VAANAESIRTHFANPDVDVAVVGAGFAGLYLLHKLRGLGFSAKVIEAADDVGGTWYWNRYPGARCDILSMDYSFTFDPELEDEWEWSERYATQPEILRYLQHVADKHDLRSDIEFSTRIDSATWDDDSACWTVHTDKGDAFTCRHYVMATGCLSKPKTIEIDGARDFKGDVYFTSNWPHEGVDFTDKRVAVIGTGSSGVQSIPVIARQAAGLTVFQRTPNFSIPAHNGPLVPEKLAALKADRKAYREAARWSRAGVPREPYEVGALQVSDEERQAHYEAMWADGELLGIAFSYNDIIVNPASNATLVDFFHERIRSIVKDPETAEALCPKDHYVGTKRPCLDTDYYATYNLENVRLVDIKKTPIKTITASGIDTSAESFDFDAIVFATGFDAMTGAIVAVDITGRDGVSLKNKWADGPETYLGLMTAGFPNFFTITGPGSPSVLSNMTVSIEQHVEWISHCLNDLRQKNVEVIEPTTTAEAGWVQHVNDFGNITLFPQANSWYMGANVPGKPRVFLPYIGGVDTYRAACNEVIEKDYLGFVLEGRGYRNENDGVIRRVQPDVQMLLDALAALNLPLMNDMSPVEAREFSQQLAAERPPGPEIGEIVDGTLPGANGDLEYRLYRPPTPGPHPVVAYFHGGGFVFGAHDSDDPFCRDLCLRSNAIIVSANYRHAPEHPFPAAAEDGFAVTQWIAENAEALGGIPGKLAVCGWSAGGNIAAGVCQAARDAGGPTICGQVLVTPVLDTDFSRGSYTENAEGYFLTADLMHWFLDHYVDEKDRNDPRVAPIRAMSLANLPPALIVTSEFDPLRDEGVDYANALAAAGVQVKHLPGRGQIHTSPTSVDVIISAASTRAEMAESLREFFD